MLPQTYEDFRPCSPRGMQMDVFTNVLRILYNVLQAKSFGIVDVLYLYRIVSPNRLSS